MRRSSDQRRRKDAFPISLSEFGRRVGRAKSSITEAVQGPLACARLPGGRLNARDPKLVEWVVARGIDPALLTVPIAVTVTVVPGRVRPDAARTAPAPAAATPAAPTPVAPAPAPPGPPPAAAPPPPPPPSAATKPRAVVSPTWPDSNFDTHEDVNALLDLSVREVGQRFGSLPGYADYLALRKTTADCKRIEIHNAERSSVLISRDYVRTHVIALIANTYRRLLADVPPTVSRRVYAAVRAGATLEEAEQLVRELISAALGNLKEAATRALRPHRESTEGAA